MARGEEGGRPLSGSQKAAALMLALGEAHCAQLLNMMHEDEIKEISAAMAQLGPVRSETIEKLCMDFAENLGGAGNLVGSFENTERLLSKSLPRDRVSQIMEEIRGPAGRTMWDKLGNVNEGVLANYLKNEYPQTVAVVLSKVRADHAARVLALLPDSFAMEVVMRMLRMESVQKDVLEGVEKTLRAEFMSNLARSTRRNAHEMMAEIFNNLDRQAEGRFVGALEERNREAAERIKSLMFTFDDLQRLTPQAVQTLLRSVDKSKLPVALKGASEKLRDLFSPTSRNAQGKCCARRSRRSVRCGCATWTRRRPPSSCWPRKWRRRARSKFAKPRMRSWFTDAGRTLHGADGGAAEVLRRGFRRRRGRSRRGAGSRRDAAADRSGGDSRGRLSGGPA
jgi:flagellar motor switch protein FliG